MKNVALSLLLCLCMLSATNGFKFFSRHGYSEIKEKFDQLSCWKKNLNLRLLENHPLIMIST